MGLDVYNEANEKLGDINELIMEKNGKVNAWSSGCRRFPEGMGEHDIAVSMDKLKFWKSGPPSSTPPTDDARQRQLRRARQRPARRRHHHQHETHGAAMR